jgi:hypothetical protein
MKMCKRVDAAKPPVKQLPSVGLTSELRSLHGTNLAQLPVANDAGVFGEDLLILAMSVLTKISRAELFASIRSRVGALRSIDRVRAWSGACL